MSSREQRRTLALAVGGTLLTLITFVSPQATVGRTVAEFSAGSAAVAWLLSSMPLGLAVALLPAGALADDRGRRRALVTGLALLAAGALVCTLSTLTAVFIAGRVVQGLGGAAVLACSLGLVAAAFPPGPGRSRATGAWGASIGAGIAVGGLLPVAADGGTGWRTSYAVTAGTALVLAVVARTALTESRAEEPRPPDIPGAVVLGVGLACLLGALVQSRSTGAGVVVWALAAASVLLLAAFVLLERRARAPMLDLGLLRHRPFLAAAAGALANGAGATALVSYLPTVLQAGLGRSLLAASLCTLLFAGTSVLTALQLRRLPAQASGRALMIGALLVLAASQLALAGLSPDSTIARLLPGLLVGGLAYGVLNAALGREAVASVPEGRASVGSGANNTVRYVGSALGVTVVALIADPTIGPVGLTSGWNRAAVVTAAVSLAGAAAIALLRPTPPRPLPA